MTGTLDKEYPIHSALKSSSARCVKEIVQMYPKQLQLKVRIVSTHAGYLVSDQVED